MFRDAEAVNSWQLTNIFQPSFILYKPFKKKTQDISVLRFSDAIVIWHGVRQQFSIAWEGAMKR